MQHVLHISAKLALKYCHFCITRLKSVCLLVDAKVGLKQNDLIALEMLEEFGSPFQVSVITVLSSSLI